MSVYFVEEVVERRIVKKKKNLFARDITWNELITNFVI